MLHVYRVATAIVIVYPLIRDRVLRTKDYDCKFLPDKNPEFVISMAFVGHPVDEKKPASFVGHHVPCVVIIVCYAVVYYEIRRLVKTPPQQLGLMWPRFHLGLHHGLKTMPQHLGLIWSQFYLHFGLKFRPQHLGLMWP